TSARTANQDVTERPSPASTSFLMASVLLSSMGATGATPAAWNQPSMTRRTLPPWSKSTSGSRASPAAPPPRRAARGPPGGGAGGARIVGGRDGDQLVVVEGRDAQLAVAHGQAHDAHVEPALHHRARDLRGIARLDDEIGARVRLAERAQGRRQEIGADRRAGADADATGHDALEALDLLHRRLELAAGAGRVGQEQVARPPGPGAPAPPLHERR